MLTEKAMDGAWASPRAGKQDDCDEAREKVRAATVTQSREKKCTRSYGPGVEKETTFWDDGLFLFPSEPPGRPRETTPRRPLTKAARRDVRRRLALAAEMKVFSVSIDGVVWTLFHPEMRAHKPSSPDDPAGGAAQGSSASTISPNCK